ncbi:MAG: 3-methyl-2-oxobutanoate hydroxymethyltransferase [Bacteroidales bacterium]|nr:3-methyl-2-oxobutanoate hydroxymethyltransferase [Bacteroidales bacterium]
MSDNSIVKKVTTQTLQQMKKDGEKITMLTCYDYSTAKIIDQAGIDAILVGDSLGNTMLGYSTTLPVTVDDMITYGASVVRGVKRAFVVVDMPFGSYQGDPRLAVKNAVRIMKETGCQAVKIEGGREIEESYKSILSAGIPIVGHLGLTPQSVNKFGGYGLRAKGSEEAQILLENAQRLQEYGCFCVVLEKIPARLATEVTQTLSIPTIGIGAGNQCDGQVLVYQDMMGISDMAMPKFVRKYGNLGEYMAKAVSEYVSDVKSGGFPSEQESY